MHLNHVGHSLCVYFHYLLILHLAMYRRSAQQFRIPSRVRYDHDTLRIGRLVQLFCDTRRRRMANKTRPDQFRVWTNALGGQLSAQNGMMHRDIASNNIMVASGPPDLRLILGDQGLVMKARIAASYCGTKIWGAPEVMFRNGEKHLPYDQSVDIFSTGILLLWFVCMFPPEEEDIQVYKGQKSFNKYWDKITGEFGRDWDDPEIDDVIEAASWMASFYPEDRATMGECWNTAWFKSWSAQATYRQFETCPDKKGMEMERGSIAQVTQHRTETVLPLRQYSTLSHGSHQARCLQESRSSLSKDIVGTPDPLRTVLVSRVSKAERPSKSKQRPQTFIDAVNSSLSTTSSLDDGSIKRPDEASREGIRDSSGVEASRHYQEREDEISETMAPVPLSAAKPLATEQL